MNEEKMIKSTPEFKCPITAFGMSKRDKTVDLDLVSTQYCESIAMNTGCANLADCPAYLAQKEKENDKQKAEDLQKV